MRSWSPWMSRSSRLRTIRRTTLERLEAFAAAPGGARVPYLRIQGAERDAGNRGDPRV